MNWINQPWPWYVAGPLLGLIVPTLLLIGNKTFGISSSLRHVCAACFPANVKFFQYDWKREVWNLFFVGGIILGALLTTFLMPNIGGVHVDPELAAELGKYGITDYSGMIPSQLFSWQSLFSLRGLIMIVGGGFLVGFGSRYAGGCTSGHAISGIANMQGPSLIATCCFMVGGLLMSNAILPLILQL